MMNRHDDLILDNQRLKAQTLELARIVDGLRRELAEEKRLLKAESTPNGYKLRPACSRKVIHGCSGKCSTICWEMPGNSVPGRP